MLKPNLHWLLVFLPIAFAEQYFHIFNSKAALFFFACLAIIPLADFLGKGTEVIAEKCGPSVGGLLNATLGNAAELIIGLIALSKGYVDVVKASLTGSIIGNLLLVVGFSMVAGGMKYKIQKFSRLHVGASCTALIIASIALFIPTVYHYVAAQTKTGWSPETEQKISFGIAVIIFFTYVFHLLFALKTHKTETEEEDGEPADGHEDSPELPWTLNKALGVLTISTIFVAIMSEYLVGTIEHVRESLGLSEMFIGIIVVAIVGNAAEHSTAILAAMKNRMDLSMEIAVGSSLQVALFLAPVLVFASYFFPKRMDLEFTIPEVVAVMSTVWITTQVVQDGESNWFEGVKLLALYLILGVLFFFLQA